MAPKLPRVVLCGFVLAGLLAAGVAQATPARMAEAGFFGMVGKVLAEWLDLGWDADRGNLDQNHKAGCAMDPNGLPCPTQAFGDAGCAMDPDGRCSTRAEGVERGPNE